MENKTYLCLWLTFSPKFDLAFFDELINQHKEDFLIGGIEEFSMEEQEVDQLLGSRAYSGGIIPDEVVEDIESYQKNKINVFKIFFYEGTYQENAAKFKNYLLKNVSEVKIKEEELEWEDWNTNWRKNYSPILISKALEIIPEWMKKDYTPKAENFIYIYPGQGFGTGGHETTFLCLKNFTSLLSQDLLKNAKSCLDFGCGSGILGISVLKMTSLFIDFCDVDHSALDNCLQNIFLNFPQTSLEGHSLISRERFENNDNTYDLIFANILEDILIKEKEVLIKHLNDKGFLIVSGILNDQLESLMKNYQELKIIEVSSLGDWSSIIFQKGKGE